MINYLLRKCCVCSFQHFILLMFVAFVDVETCPIKYIRQRAVRTLSVKLSGIMV